MTDYTHLVLIVDSSGSMTAIQKDMNGSLKKTLDEQAGLPGKFRVDAFTFDSVVKHVYRDVKAEHVEPDLVQPGGMTALNDGMGIAIDTMGEFFAALPEDERPDKVIVAVFTDGGENSSKEYTVDQVKEAVKRQQDEWGWEFVFAGANIDAFATAASYGFAAGSTMQYIATPQGATATASGLSGYMKRARSNGDEPTEFLQSERDAAGG